VAAVDRDSGSRAALELAVQVLGTGQRVLDVVHA
jgi:hypothetical protein